MSAKPVDAKRPERVLPATPPPTKPGPSSSSSKRVRVTASDGRSVDLTFDPSVTFAQLQSTIAKELRCFPLSLFLYLMC